MMIIDDHEWVRACVRVSWVVKYPLPSSTRHGSGLWRIGADTDTVVYLDALRGGRKETGRIQNR
jgi:hypothetical protein